MATVTNSRQILYHLELPSPASSSSTSIKRDQIPFGKPKKKSVPLNIALAASAFVGVAHTIYKRRNSILSTGGGNGGGGTNGGFGGDGGGGGGGRFSGKLLSCSSNSEENNQSQEVTEVELENKHSDLQKYILSGISIRAGSETTFIKVISRRVYPTKAQIESYIKRKFNLVIRQEIHFEEKSNPDGTIRVTATLICDTSDLNSLFNSQGIHFEEKSILDETIRETGKLNREYGLEGIYTAHGVVIGYPFVQENSGGTYTETKGQLQKLLEKGGDLEAGTNLAGTIAGFFPEEHMWDSLFPKIQSHTRWDKKNGGVTYMQQSDDVKTECSIVTGFGGPLALASLEPRGIISFEYLFIQGNDSIIFSVASGGLFHLQDDINCNVKYVQGNTFSLCSYKDIKRSPALKTGVDQVHHPTWVAKDGYKANITKNFTPQTNAIFGMVFEKITAYNHSNEQRLSDGPPTTPSGGNQQLYGQATLERDNTKFVNGAIVGDKIKFQIDRSLGLCERVPHFNHYQLTMTRFIQLKETEEGVGKPSPPVLVLHARYGGCAGDLLPHDTFTLGGPDSVRGYNVGEIGAARNIIEVAAEVRVPVRNTQVYAFAEHGIDLGNPNEVHGSSYGVGAKLGFVRVEYAINHNSHTGGLSVRFGERF